MATELERTQIAVLQNDMKQVKSDISELKINQAAGFASIEAKMDAQDKKYASKTVEVIVYGLVSLIVVAFFTNLLGLWKIAVPSSQPTNANNPTTSSTTTTTTPTGSTGVTTTRDGTPGANANAQSKSDTATPSDSQTSSDNGGVKIDLPKVP